MRHDSPAFRQKIFNIAEAQREPMIEPHGVADDLGWKAETWVAEGRRSVGHAALLPLSMISAQLDDAGVTKKAKITEHHSL